MQTILYIENSRYTLTDEHSASSYGIPVLVTPTGDVLTANNRIAVMKDGEVYTHVNADMAAQYAMEADSEAREWAGKSMSEEEVALVKRFVNSRTPSSTPAPDETDDAAFASMFA